jgi:hypothetical protein
MTDSVACGAGVYCLLPDWLAITSHVPWPLVIV